MKIAEELRKKLDDERRARVLKRVEKLKSRTARNFFLTNLSYPENKKSETKRHVLQSLQEFEKLMSEIKNILKSVKSKYIPHIWEHNVITAAYLLTAKAFSNLETVILLAKEGKTFEIIEIARSGQESLDLAALFLFQEQDGKLEKWFKGDYIHNADARAAIHRAINKDKEFTETVPVYFGKTLIYDTYSLYTHSTYGALLDNVDVFHEDYDYDKIAGYHYTLKNVDIGVKQLAISLLLQLKHIFASYNDDEGLKKVEELLEKLGDYKASPEEIKSTFKKYGL